MRRETREKRLEAADSPKGSECTDAADECGVAAAARRTRRLQISARTRRLRLVRHAERPLRRKGLFSSPQGRLILRRDWGVCAQPTGRTVLRAFRETGGVSRRTSEALLLHRSECTRRHPNTLFQDRLTRTLRRTRQPPSTAFADFVSSEPSGDEHPTLRFEKDLMTTRLLRACNRRFSATPHVSDF